MRERIKKKVEEKTLLSIPEILSISAFAVILVGAIWLFSLYILLNYIGINHNNNQTVEESQPESIDPPDQSTNILTPTGRSYIDPALDKDAESYIQDSLQNFEISFETNTFGGKYIAERDFIAANLEFAYQMISSRLGVKYIERKSVIITDKQSFFEQEYGFDFDHNLNFAGVSNRYEIILLVNEISLLQKQKLYDVIAHEVVHTLQFESVSSPTLPYPLWFTEGSASYFSSNKALSSNISGLDSGIEYDFQSLKQLEDSFYSPEFDTSYNGYILSKLFIQYLVEEFSENSIVQLVKLSENDVFYVKFKQITDSTPDEVYEEWVKNIHLE